MKRLQQAVLQKIRFVIYIFWESFPFKKITAADTSIDVIIPAIESDLSILPLCIEGLRQNVNHTIKNIYLISPATASIKSFAAENGLVFLDEATLFDYTPADINYVITAGRRKGLDRSGWIYQQLIKLSGRAGTCRYYLVTDADHVLLKPHSFIAEDGRTVFYQSPEYHVPYYRAIKKLLRFYPVTMFSYVSHKMLFDKESLKELQQHIEKNNGNGQPWDKAILSNLNSNETSDFSEFELYGNFISPGKKILRPWKDKMIDQAGTINYKDLQRRYPSRMSVTIPHYLRNPF